MRLYTPTKFWMVKGDGPTNYRHETQVRAEAEAERLAAANPGQPFVVLEACTAFRCVTVQRFDLRDSPAEITDDPDYHDEVTF